MRDQASHRTALWFLSWTKGSSRPAVLLEKGNPLIRAGISFTLGIDSNGSIVYEWDGSDGKRYSIVSSDGRDYADGRWHNLAIVRDGAKVVMYIDGRSLAYREVRATPVSNSCDIYVNAMPDYSYTAKAMVYVAIWDRALSDEEVLALYNGDEVMADAIAKLDIDVNKNKNVSTIMNKNVFNVNGESISIRWYHVGEYGRDVIIVLSNGIYMQSWQSISILKGSIMLAAHGAMYHEAFFGSNGL